MTVEEIEQTLLTVAGNQAQLTEAQIKSEARQERLNETVKQIAESHQTIIQLVRMQEERLDGHDIALRATDEKLNALIDAQIGLESRQARLEESHQLLVQLARIQEERIDGQDEARRETNSRLDALIDSQIQLTQRVDTLTGDITALNVRFERTDERLDRIAALQADNAEQIKLLIAAQARTDEQFRLLLERNGASKPKRKTAKKAGSKRAEKPGKKKGRG